MKKNWSLWLALALPVAMIVFVAASIYLPRLWAQKPSYGFVYVVNDTKNGYVVPQYTVRVENGQLVKEPVVQDMTVLPPVPVDMKPRYVEPHLYRYDIVTGESKSIGFEEAAQLKLDDRKKSPDSFEVSQGGGYGGPFDGGSRPALYMVGHAVSYKLDLRGVASPYPYDFEFIGWVTE